MLTKENISKKQFPCAHKHDAAPPSPHNPGQEWWSPDYSRLPFPPNLRAWDPNCMISSRGTHSTKLQYEYSSHCFKEASKPQEDSNTRHIKCFNCSVMQSVHYQLWSPCMCFCKKPKASFLLNWKPYLESGESTPPVYFPSKRAAARLEGMVTSFKCTDNGYFCCHIANMMK